MTRPLRGRREVFGVLAAGTGGLALGCVHGDPRAASPQGRAETQGGGCEENEVLPVEDLMREHGVLRRILLVYGECIGRIEAQPPRAGVGDFPPDALTRTADIVRRFVEDYHEKLEEDSLFPRFRRAGKLTTLVDVLTEQHKAGRRITQQLLATTPAALRDAQGRRALADSLRAFVRMYEPHAAREDTVLFPALHGLVSAHEYDALGDEFEAKEKQLFGQDGFEKIVAEVDAIEKSLGIEDLALVTPK